jgi:hypothetical protein
VSAGDRVGEAEANDGKAAFDTQARGITAAANLARSGWVGSSARRSG